MSDIELFENTLRSIETSDSLSALRHVILELISEYGLSNAAYHAVNIPGSEKENAVLLLSYPDDWVKRYIDLDYFRIDPVVKAGRNGFLPIDWASVDKGSFDVQRFFADADRFDVGRNGLSLPIKGRWGERAIFTVTSNASGDDWARLKMRCMRDFQVLGHFVHDKALEIGGYCNTSPRRSPSLRERQCLQALGRGRAPKQIAADLQISESAVRFYLHSARSKLGCATIAQAAATASNLNIIEI